MNTYIYAEAPADDWPVVDSIVANSYEDGIEKLIERYADLYEDDDILARGFDNFLDFQEHMNNVHELAIGDLIDIESI